MASSTLDHDLTATVASAGDPGADVRAFVAEHPAAMLYHQPPWLALIGRMTGAVLHQAVVRDDRGEVRAWAPLFLKEGPYGVIANSSPYFGSHGGILAAGDADFRAAAEAIDNFLRAQSVACANIIEPLFEPNNARYHEVLPLAMGDERHGQIRSLDGCATRDGLLDTVGGLVRSNLKRKSWRAGITVDREETEDALAWLCEQHVAEMSARPAGNPKSPDFFAAISELFEPGADWRLYTATIDGTRVAGLLVVCWRDTVEYLTPVQDPAARAHQPSSALVFEAMRSCAEEGYRWWNFGGTWPSQTGLKAYKDSWGCAERTYRYHVLDYGGLADLMRPEIRPALQEAYPGFYFYPFAAPAEPSRRSAGGAAS